MTTSPRAKSAKVQPDVFQRITKIVQKAFKIAKAIAHLLYVFLENSFRLIAFCFSLIVRLLSEPSTPCVVAICLFMLVSVITLAQWAAIGVWLGQLLGIREFWGIGTAIGGVLLGLGINIYQLAPQLWQIREDVAVAFLKLKVETKDKIEATTPEEKLGNWLSANYSQLKFARLASYSLETGLVLAYCALAANMSFFAIMHAAISLILPEQTLNLVQSTIGFFASLQRQMEWDAEAEQAAYEAGQRTNPNHVHL